MEPDKIGDTGVFCNAAKPPLAASREKRAVQALPSILKIGLI
jgi:hypothetical protein